MAASATASKFARRRFTAMRAKGTLGRMPPTPPARAMSAECFGTFSLVFVGTAAVTIDRATGGALGHVGVSLVFGLVVAAMVYAVGEVSGAHINPAVTLGFFAAGRMPGRLVLPYVASQCAGAFLASAVVLVLFPGDPRLGATIPAGPHAQSFLLEVVLALILMFTILSVSTGGKERGVVAGGVVGAVIAFEALVGGPVSGASMNPARSLAPAVVSGSFEGLWIYLVAPPLGALLAVGGCVGVQGRACCPARPVAR
jgi:aquaporin NIP